MAPRVPPVLRKHLYRSFSSSTRIAADHVRIVEVGPRDGLQNEKGTIPLETKLELIRRLAQTGVQTMEAGSFVPAKWVPQVNGIYSRSLQEILTNPPSSPQPIMYNYLIPNVRGLENMVKMLDGDSGSLKAPLDSGYPTPPPSPQAENTPPSSRNTVEISLFAAATEAFSRANTNCSIAESLERCKPIVAMAKEHNLRPRGYVSVALGCPYEGPDVDPHKVAEITASLLEMGCDEVSIADTTGMGTVPRTRKLLEVLKAAGIRMEDIALHFHDTYGQALVNTIVGLENEVRIFDSSVGGLGGCPYSKGATGNVSTEDLVHLLHSLGVETGIDLGRMAEIGGWISGELSKQNDSRAGKATLSRMSQQ